MIVRGKGIKHIASIISPYNRGEKILLQVLSNLKQQKKASPIPVLFNALKQLAPGLKVLPQIRAGRTIFLSASLTEKSSRYYAMRWCLNTDNVNLKTPLHQRLTYDLLDAFKKTGHAYSFKKDLNQSVINSRVNAKPIYRGKSKSVLRQLFKRKRKLVYKFRRLCLLRTRFKIKTKAKFNPRRKRRISARRKYRFKVKFMLKPKRKKKSRPIYLTDYIPPSIKSRVRDKRYALKLRLQLPKKPGKKTYKKLYSKRSSKFYKKRYTKFYNKGYNKYKKKNKIAKKKLYKFKSIKIHNPQNKIFVLKLKLKKKKKVKLSRKLFKERISYIISMLAIFKNTTSIRNNSKNRLRAVKAPIKKVKKFGVKKTKNTPNNDNKVPNIKKKSKKAKKKLSPDNQSVIRKKKKLLKTHHASKSNTN